MDSAIERQLSIFDTNWFGGREVHFGGVGGVGSNAARIVAQTGVRVIHAWDGKKVSAHNWHNQFYPKTAVGEPKVHALKRLIEEWTNTTVVAHEELIDGPRGLAGIVFLGPDSVTQRRIIYESSIRDNPNVELVIDMRMDATYIIVYTFDPRDAKHRAMYQHTLHKQNEAENLIAACGSPVSVAVTATDAARTAVEQLIRWAALKQGTQQCELNNMIAYDLWNPTNLRTQVWPHGEHVYA